MVIVSINNWYWCYYPILFFAGNVSIETRPNKIKELHWLSKLTGHRATYDLGFKNIKKCGKISGKLRLPVTEALHIKGECGTLVILRRTEVIDGSKPPGTQARQRLFMQQNGSCFLHQFYESISFYCGIEIIVIE